MTTRSRWWSRLSRSPPRSSTTATGQATKLISDEGGHGNCTTPDGITFMRHRAHRHERAGDRLRKWRLYPDANLAQNELRHQDQPSGRRGGRHIGRRQDHRGLLSTRGKLRELRNPSGQTDKDDNHYVNTCSSAQPVGRAVSFFRPRFRPTENRRSLSTGAVAVFPLPRKQQVQTVIGKVGLTLFFFLLFITLDLAD